LELRHLRYCVAVAEESTIVAAAKRLRIAQPAVTRQIHDLEKELDVDLFERGARGMEITPAGEVCLATARHILRQVNVAMAQARGASLGVVGQCVICVGARGLSSGLIARIVARVHEEYPGIDLIVTEGVGFRQWSALRLLEADLGLGLPASAEYADLVSETIDHDLFDAIVISNKHPLASREAISLADLAEHTFLAWKSTLAPDYHRLQKVEFTRRGFKPSKRRDFVELADIISAVSADQGWTFFPRRTPGLAPAGTKIIPLLDFAIPMAHTIVSRRAEQRPVVFTVIDAIRRVVAADRTADGRPPISAPLLKEVTRGGIDVGVDNSGDRTIELRHLRYFCAVVDTKSFGRAAERLELTQPALSRQIGDLEHVVGIKLFDRTSRGVTTTPGGDAFYKSAVRILDEAAALHAEAHRAQRGEHARCVIGIVPTNETQKLIATLLRRCADETPTLELTVEHRHTPEQPAELRSAHLDLGLCHASPMSPIEERGIRRERLLNDQLTCALVATESPLATRKSVALWELADIPFIFPARSFQPGLYDEVFSAFDGGSFKPRVDASYEGLKTIWAMVAEGRGWGVGFQSQCSHPPPGTVAVPIDGFSLPWGVDVLARADESRTIILLVIDMLHEIAFEHEMTRANQAQSVNS
jgi:DNA-binding transcriptional LysR family regulator